MRSSLTSAYLVSQVDKVATDCSSPVTMATTKPMEKMKDLLGYFLAAMAMFALLCAIYEAMNERISSAGLLAGIFLVAVLLFYLPQLELIKAFGVEAKMRATLNEAQEIVARMKNLAEANAEATYLLIARGNRWGGMPYDEKQRIIDGIDSQLRSLGATDSDLEKIKSRDFIPFIAYDIKEVFENTLSSLAVTVNSSASNDWLKNFQHGGWLSLETIRSKNGQQLTQLLTAEIPDVIKTDDRQKLMILATQIGSLYDGCIKKGGYTQDTIKFLTRFQALRGDALVNEVFKLN